MLDKKNKSFSSIGIVLGETNIDQYNFCLKNFKAKKGDIVTTDTKIPNDEGEIITVKVWGKIMSINRSNMFFPNEAAQELTNEDIDIRNTILPMTKDELICRVQILGYTHINDKEKLKLKSLNYPVNPAASVNYPSSNEVQKLLASDLGSKHPMYVGNLTARKDVDIFVDTDNMVSRHILITGMSGSGKTVMVRRAVSELMKKQYPILIIDIHGDYLGFVSKAKKYFPNNQVKLFYPNLTVSSGDKEIIYTLIEKLGKSLTEPQNDFLNSMLSKVEYENGTLCNYIKKLIKYSEACTDDRNAKKNGTSFNHVKAATMYVVTRSLRHVLKRLNNMEQTNLRHRNNLPHLKFDELPDPSSEPEKIICKSQLSILYLKGYETLPAGAIVSILMDTLFKHRAENTGEIPPFITVIEEAHNFIPSRAEDKDGIPSVDTVRKVITEGRKFGTGLMLVSQRPYRLDETIVSQCNSHVIFRVKNERDQRFIKNILENFDNDDAKQLPNLGNGQGVISGQIVNFSLPVQIKFDEHLINDDLGDENFIDLVHQWDDKEIVKQRKKFSKEFEKISSSDMRRPN